MTTHEHLLPVYLRLRQAGLRLNHKLVGTLSKEALHEGARRLGMLHGETLVFDSEDETSVLMDYCIYNLYSGGKNAAQRYLAESPPGGPDEMIFLQAMQTAYYSILQVTDVERGVGVAVRDLLRGGTGFLVDVGFGSSAQPGWSAAGRVIPLEDFLISGGTRAADKRRGHHPDRKGIETDRSLDRFFPAFAGAGSRSRRHGDSQLPQIGRRRRRSGTRRLAAHHHAGTRRAGCLGRCARTGTIHARAAAAENTRRVAVSDRPCRPEHEGDRGSPCTEGLSKSSETEPEACSRPRRFFFARPSRKCSGGRADAVEFNNCYPALR